MATAINWKMKCTANNVMNIRSGAGTSFKIIGTMAKGDIVTATEKEGEWVKHNRGGWSHTSLLQIVNDSGGVPGLSQITNDVTYAANTGTGASTSEDEEVDMNFTDINLDELQKELETLFSAKNLGNTVLRELRNTWGMPFQLTRYSDPRISKMDFGRKYYENIVLNAPLMTLIPGKPVFMKGVSNSKKEGIVNMLFDSQNNNVKSSIGEIMDGTYGNYYSFESDYTHYIRYVNRLCRQAAIYLDIGNNRMYDGAPPYKNFDWNSFKINGKRITEVHGSLFGQDKTVSFFIDSASSMNESASNDTGESQLKGMLQSAGDLAKEAAFLFGPMTGKPFKSVTYANYEENIAKLADQYSQNTSGLVDRLKATAGTVIQGGNLLFPEIWRDSNYTRSYNVTIKLHSPYGDPESIFLNILVPFFHIIALAFPRQVATAGSNGYVAPFIVRAYCRSLFNCSYGIVDSVSFTKGQDNNWTIDLLPTEMEISLSIKDLYSALTIYGGNKSSIFFSNTGLVDFISTATSVTTYQKDLTRSIQAFMASEQNVLPDIVKMPGRKLQEGFKNFFINRLNW